jgi:hypothetical protein
MQSRRASPRIPYDEAVCLTPADAGARIYGRGLDLGTGGMSLVCAASCPVGTEARCDLLLPGGPRPVTGRIVRVTAAPGGFELAIAFVDLRPGFTGVIDDMVAAYAAQAAPAKVQIDGAPAAGRSDLAADEGPATSGAIRKVAMDAPSGDGVPRLALEGDSGDGPRETTEPYGPPPATSLAAMKPLPTSLPAPFGQPLPSVVVEPELEASTETPTPTLVLAPPPPPLTASRQDAAAVAAPAAPARAPADKRRARPRPSSGVQGTAVVARRPAPPAWNWQQPALLVVTPAPLPELPRRASLLDAPLSARSLMLLAPILVLVLALVVELSR